MINPFRRPARRIAPSQTDVVVSRTFRARIIFVTSYPGRVVVDLITEPGEYATAVISLDAFVPRTLWALAAGAQLDRWAASSADVELSFRYSNGNYSDGKPTVKLSDGTTLLVLDLCRVSDLPGDPDPAGKSSVPQTAVCTGSDAG